MQIPQAAFPANQSSTSGSGDPLSKYGETNADTMGCLEMRPRPDPIAPLRIRVESVRCPVVRARPS